MLRGLMPTLHPYVVVPRLPKILEPIREVAYNLLWSWSPAAVELFRRIDPNRWESLHGNPIELLASVPQSRLEELAKDESFTSHMEAVVTTFKAYVSREGWFKKRFPDAKEARIAYFSMEFGLHESLPIYSGGLGVLAGDHLKSASDLGLPLVGIGLAYAEGYFRQALSEDGWQAERYPTNDWNRMPVQPVLEPGGKRLILRVAYPDRTVLAQIWRVQVGRIPLLLLDTNIEANLPADRAITGALYGGDQEFRVRQEVMLGIGGLHALYALGMAPTVCHMNEGHSAFLALERIARFMREKGATFQVAREACSAGNVFTTHTPVPAGNDSFPNELVRRALEPYRLALGITERELLALGNATPTDTHFSMPVLAIRTADLYNGVSRLHGEVSRKMYQPLWPDVPIDEVPVNSVTNGTHIATWVSAEHGALFTRYLGPRWMEETDSAELWARAHDIPDAELWQTHEHRRHRLVTHARAWLRQAAIRRDAPDHVIRAADEVLDPSILTIGFARRFATYKRAALLFSDRARLKRLLHDPARPVQFVFAGKAHPQDRGGKELIRQIVQASRDPDYVGKVVFIEDYDMSIARALVSGVDVWLNNPRRPHEASGTSGMKAAANGALNLSVLDGWWAEAYEKHGTSVGWAIGRGEEYADDAGDALEAEALYGALESEVVPLFYDRRDRGQLPREWIRRMKNAIGYLVPEFNTSRMVREYTERAYAPAHMLSMRLEANGMQEADALVKWKDKVKSRWTGVAVKSVTPDGQAVEVGGALPVEALVDLGGLQPNDVRVELYFGPTEGRHELNHGKAIEMKLAENGANGGAFRYRGAVPTHESGTHALTVRVIPYNDLLTHRHETTLIRWA